MADIAPGMGRWWIPHYQSTVSPGIAQAVFDMASGSPGPVSIFPAMQAIVRPGNEQPLVRWRHKGKIEHPRDNGDDDDAKGKYPEMPFAQNWPLICLGQLAVYDHLIPPDFFSFTCHYLRCTSSLKSLEDRPPTRRRGPGSRIGLEWLVINFQGWRKIKTANKIRWLSLGTFPERLFQQYRSLYFRLLSRMAMLHFAC